jgi:ubiquinone biosynthesis UbiH/UbiF/VisC/COQ6 family hydroxylase
MTIPAHSARRRENYEFTVIGDGPVGLLAAIGLSQQGRSVALVTPTPAPSENTPFDAPDLRVYALAPDALDVLAGHQCELRQHPRVCAYQNMSVFDQNPQAALNFQALDYGWSSLGHIVEHQLLCAELWRVVVQQQIKIVLGKASSFSQEDGVATLHTEQASVRARWLIDASGAVSALREASGLRQSNYDYQQSAVVAHVRSQMPHAHTAWQRFTPVGTIALLPMFDGTQALVYSALEAKAQALMALSDAAFLADLAANFGPALGPFSTVGARRKIPLRRALAENYVADPLILLGDSAHTVHPLAGQGLNLGIRDVACLTRSIAKATSDAQMLAALKRFARERKSENAITAHGIEAIQKLFLPSTGPLALLRRVGLNGVNRLTPLKRLFAELATGKVAGWPGAT